MVTVATRVRAIAELEGFDIIVKQGGKPISVADNGVLGRYGYDRAARHTKSVNEWKNERFAACYAGFTCDVLRGDGRVASGQTSLRTVRESYEE